MKLMMLTQLKSYWFVVQKNIVYTKGVIRSRKTGNTTVKTKGTKRQTIIYKTLNIKLKIKQHVLH
jgi:hypothetical protein